MSNDVDLAEIFGIAESDVAEEKALEVEEVSDLDRLRMGLSAGIHNDGTGDVMQDLLNWVTDNDKIPSDPLSSFLSNAALKAEYGLFFMLLNNLSRVKVISEFVVGAEQVLYSPTNILTMDPDDLQKRYEEANKSMDNLLKHSKSIVYGLQKDKDKNKEMDKLQMLLSSIPTEKLKELIKSLR